MKRKLLVTILGLTATTAAFGQGHVLLSNYLSPPYNQVYYAGLAGPAQPACNDASVILTLWYGEGNITDPGLLVQGVTFSVFPAGSGPGSYNPGVGHGPGGYYLAPDNVLPTWQPGDTFTFQIRASGSSPFGPVDTLLSRSILWTENSAIVAASVPANSSANSIGLPIYIPEPSSQAMLGLGLGSLLVYRRRHTSREE